MNNKKMRILLIIQVISLLLTTAVVCGIIVYYLDRKDIPNNVQTLSEKVKIIDERTYQLESKIESINSNIPEPKNGIDGKDGRDGKDSLSTHTIEKETVIKEVPVKGDNGLTPIIRCNTLINAWQIKYSQEDSWKLLNNEYTQCTIGTGE